MLEFFKRQLQVFGRIAPRVAPQPSAPVGVHPFKVHRVNGVFLRLQPVAGDVGKHRLHKTVGPVKGFPVGQLGRGQGAHVGPEQAGQRLDRVGLDLDLAFLTGLRIDLILVGPCHALPLCVVLPAVVVAADAVCFNKAIAQVGAAVCALAVHQPVTTAQVFVEHQVFTHQPHRLDRVAVEFVDARNRVPVAAQHLAHGRAGTDLGQLLVFFGAEHGLGPAVIRP